MPALDISRAEVALASGDLATLGSELATLFPLDPDVDRVQDLIRLALGQPAPELTLSGTASVFFDSIKRTRRLLDSGQPEQTRREPRVIGRDLDFIASLDGIDGWTIPQCLNFLLLEQIRPAHRAAVVGTMRDDGI